MKCALVWRNGYAELRVMQCNADEFEYLKKQIGKSVEVEIRPTQPAPDAGDSVASSELVQASALSTSQTLPSPQRG